MPSPHDQQHTQSQSYNVLRDYFAPPEHDLVAEVRALRSEIAHLRAELKPVSSLILTGQQVAAEFRRLTQPEGK